ncbi:MAG: GNAT family N-acetyltransferase [Flavobacteriales bacterium]
MRIAFIKANECWPLRHKVLRPHQSIEDCDYPNDRNPDSFHLGAFEGGRLVGIGSFYREKQETLVGHIQWRLRGMAIDPDFRGTGVGRQLLRFGMDELKSKRADILWCQARESAEGFYAKLGFAIKGEPFTLEGIGVHYIMYLSLVPVQPG